MPWGGNNDVKFWSTDGERTAPQLPTIYPDRASVWQHESGRAVSPPPLKTHSLLVDPTSISLLHCPMMPKTREQPGGTRWYHRFTRDEAAFPGVLRVFSLPQPPLTEITNQHPLCPHISSHCRHHLGL
jgi:hypothetical protein